jgi:hypothetical protein
MILIVHSKKQKEIFFKQIFPKVEEVFFSQHHAIANPFF